MHVCVHVFSVDLSVKVVVVIYSYAFSCALFVTMHVCVLLRGLVWLIPCVCIGVCV